MARGLLTSRCWCGRPGVVLFHGEFWCAICSDVMLADSPAHEFLRMEEASEAATNLIAAIDAGLIR